MPRACPVEGSRLQLSSSEREAPRHKAVASKPFENCLSSSDPETPRGKPVVSAKRGVSTRQARGICCDLETPREKRMASTASVAVASAVSQIFNELTSQ